MNLQEILLLAIAAGVWAIVMVLAYGLFYTGSASTDGEHE